MIRDTFLQRAGYLSKARCLGKMGVAPQIVSPNAFSGLVSPLEKEQRHYKAPQWAPKAPLLIYGCKVKTWPPVQSQETFLLPLSAPSSHAHPCSFSLPPWLNRSFSACHREMGGGGGRDAALRRHRQSNTFSLEAPFPEAGWQGDILGDMTPNRQI